MQIEYINTKDLIPYANNPRRNDEAVDGVANSIERFGFKVPIVIDKNNVIVCGHTRLRAAEQLGLETVPCIKADDLTDEQIKAFRLADNKVSEVAAWDYELLNSEIEEITGIDMTEFGFEVFECRSVIAYEVGRNDDLVEQVPLTLVSECTKSFFVQSPHGVEVSTIGNLFGIHYSTENRCAALVVGVVVEVAHDDNFRVGVGSQYRVG